jgi:hypothetical protein
VVASTGAGVPACSEPAPSVPADGVADEVVDVPEAAGVVEPALLEALAARDTCELVVCCAHPDSATATDAATAAVDMVDRTWRDVVLVLVTSSSFADDDGVAHSVTHVGAPHHGAPPTDARPAGAGVPG